MQKHFSYFHTADVSFDGKAIVSHYNAFTPFSAVIADVEITPQLTCGRWSAETEVFVCNVSGREMEISVEVKLAGCCMEKTVTVGGGCKERLVFAMEFDEVQAWSNAQPALYFLQAVLSVNGEPADDLIERVGFRTVTLDGSKIMVNGEAVYLKGFNRHEDYASGLCNPASAYGAGYGSDAGGGSECAENLPLSQR
ncbi:MULTISPECIES: hypothetical protein [Eisenbergiella]|uniref:hypothetical protein n=1 Tax=Eisenbergiella TaxID=1432051 RepID=UPI0018A6B58F|nr:MULTISPECIES: hypothetical protein [Eisenbergiella]MDY2654019.1 hypothetical protein [Eisenbergiella porci]